MEMDAEVQWKPSGTIRGTVRGPSPHLDSPPIRVLANDRHHVAIRMRNFGAGVRTARFSSTVILADNKHT